MIAVSPPTRGWTLAASQRALSTGGFPAHAGMDLNADNAMTPAARFPRPRGDGPFSRVGISGLQRVSPPTRGWTSS